MELSQEINLTREEKDGRYIYISNGRTFNEQGIKININSKFESYVDEPIKQQKQQQEQKKEQKQEQKQGKETEEGMDPQFAANVYTFTKSLVEGMMNHFDGKVVGSDEMDLDQIMKFHFPDYTPGTTMKKVKKGNKKPRPLSGYAYFGQQNKEKFNKEMDAMEEKPKYVKYVSDKWKEVSEEDKKEWTKKAKEAFEENNPSTSDSE